ncbi:MAG TPA: methyltransferase domain-containing protein [Candidatus Paceibacterota bacterium]|nr:methyltransferase domain-containing protein [Candidatus Paceibacterota bacterium]
MSADHSNKNLGGRVALAYSWLPGGMENVLDVGCAWGDGVFSLSRKSAHAYGIDTNADYIKKATKRFPQFSFLVSAIESTPFENQFFDAIAMNDVLEHARDELKSLNEVHRILKPGGICVITVPHKGWFAFLDPANYKFYLMKRFPALFSKIYDYVIKNNPDFKNKVAEGFHRHYSLAGLRKLLNSSNFNGHFKVERVFKSGLVLGVLNNNLRASLRRVVGVRAARALLFPLAWLAGVEYWIPFGPLSYNIAVAIRKQ